MLYHHCFSTLFELGHQECPREPGKSDIEWDTSVLAYADDVNMVG
jgi:hypothetical protein